MNCEKNVFGRNGTILSKFLLVLDIGKSVRIKTTWNKTSTVKFWEVQMMDRWSDERQVKKEKVNFRFR